MNGISKCISALVLIIGIMTLGCERGPKVIEASNHGSTTSSSSGVFSEEPSTDNASTNADFHSVVVNEVLPTEKYVYLNVTEGDETYWVATLKTEVEVGETYFYRGGLMKTNFESKEYDRVFDKVILVSNVVKTDHSQTMTSDKPLLPPAKAKEPRTYTSDVQVEGSIKISELVKNASDYDGKMVQLTGTCVKINPNIMGRNWIHLKDGSKDDYDMVITSDEVVPEGSTVTLNGKVVLNKDFGAGYKYDLIVEGAVVQNK